MKTAHERLRWLRDKAGYDTATEAQENMDDVANSTYLAHENSSRNVSYAAARRYALFYGCRAEWLLHGTGPIRANQKHPLLELYDDLPPNLQEQAMGYLQFLRKSRQEEDS